MPACENIIEFFITKFNVMNTHLAEYDLLFFSAPAELNHKTTISSGLCLGGHSLGMFAKRYIKL